MRRFAVALVLAALGCDRDVPRQSAPSAIHTSERREPAGSGARRRPIELVLQREAMDCGVAALTMTLNSYGRATTLESLGREMPAHELGLSALDIVTEAKKRGLGARGYRLAVDELPRILVAGDILHFSASHFVVFDRVAADGIHLFDPAAGKSVVALDQVAREYSGVALVFADNPSALERRMATTDP